MNLAFIESFFAYFRSEKVERMQGKISFQCSSKFTQRPRRLLSVSPGTIPPFVDDLQQPLS